MNDDNNTNELDTHRLQPLLAPRTVAIVGASSREESFGLSVASTFLTRKFPGRAYAVNPRYSQVLGLPCFASVAELPEPPDLAILVVANKRLEEEMKKCAAAGVRAAVIFGSTYLEQDDPEQPLLVRLAEIARVAGMQVCGSNCLGFQNVRDNVHATLAPPHERLQPGPAVFISHSGTAFGEMVDIDGRVGLNFAVSEWLI